ncbi:anti-sigma factor [Curtobacterium aurantiacum]|uniref:Anti-sigma factor n=1 Tax=Curtobacterium aurantiacum TaxID=3236919 RepID=A0ABS5VED8_9MICO|nr:anti-sigma factor [Curtobacterium flaccumfaciens]MBT1544685.1 anti-sigma factor [Curtobacterium flaccumfaciens pv. flaccumfaciens]MBT1587863.1 anti-sigma factor [Curtobacterium flaccumfaciens pv. flaccumfaciens]
MKHVDDETLAMLAVSDEVAEDDVAEHLASCARCRDEVAVLQRVAAVTRASEDVELAAPPEHVWERIAAEIARTPQHAAAPAPAPAPAPATEPERAPGREPGQAPAPAATSSELRHHAASRRPRSRPRRRRALAAAIAGVGVLAVVLGIGVASGIVPGLPRGDTETVLANTELDALPGWSGTTGTAELERDQDGRVTLVVDLHGERGRSGTGPLREVWMMRADLAGLVSVGYLDGDRGRFTVPAGLDTERFPVVDVSAEADDGDPAHSGDSIVRGTLTDP